MGAGFCGDSDSVALAAGCGLYKFMERELGFGCYGWQDERDDRTFAAVDRADAFDYRSLEFVAPVGGGGVGASSMRGIVL